MAPKIQEHEVGEVTGFGLRVFLEEPGEESPSFRVWLRDGLGDELYIGSGRTSADALAMARRFRERLGEVV